MWLKTSACKLSLLLIWHIRGLLRTPACHIALSQFISFCILRVDMRSVQRRGYSVAAAAAMQRVWRGSADFASMAAGNAAPSAPGWDEQRAAAPHGPTAHEQRVQYTMLPWAYPQAVHEIVCQGASRHAAADTLHICLLSLRCYESRKCQSLAHAVDYAPTEQVVVCGTLKQLNIATLCTQQWNWIVNADVYDLTPVRNAGMKSRWRWCSTSRMALQEWIG